VSEIWHTGAINTAPYHTNKQQRQNHNKNKFWNQNQYKRKGMFTPSKKAHSKMRLWKPDVYSHRHNVSIDLAGTKNANATKSDMRAHILLEKKEHKKNGLKKIWN
jgi:hypothetical protein